jgi:hypothetical protein
MNSVKKLLLFATLLLTASLLFIQFQIFHNTLGFWIIIFSWLSLLSFQILSQNKNYTITLVIIIIFLSFLRIVYHPSLTLWGTDPYVDYGIAYGIQCNGWEPNTPTVVPFFSDFPLIHIFGVITSFISGIDLYLIVKWLPLSFSIPLVLFIFLIGKTIFESESSAVIAALAFSFLSNTIEMYSMFIKESLGIIFFLCIIFCYFMYRRSNEIRYLLLSYVFILSLVLSHHFTSLLLLLFFGIYFFVQEIIVRSKFLPLSKVLSVESVFLLIILITMLLYWIQLTNSPLEWFINTLREDHSIRYIATATKLEPSLRHLLFRYKEVIFAPIFGIISIYAIYLRKNNLQNFEFPLLIYGSLLGILTVFQTMMVGSKGGGNAWGARFMTFGYFSLFLLVSYSISNKISLKKVSGKIMYVILIIYIIFNIAYIPPSLYTTNSNVEELDGGRFYLLPSEHFGILWLTEVSDDKVIAVPNRLLIFSISLRNVLLRDHNIIVGVDQDSISRKSNFYYAMIDNNLYSSNVTYYYQIYNNGMERWIFMT